MFPDCLRLWGVLQSMGDYSMQIYLLANPIHDFLGPERAAEPFLVKYQVLPSEMLKGLEEWV